jgi:hypothetical protein
MITESSFENLFFVDILNEFINGQIIFDRRPFVLLKGFNDIENGENKLQLRNSMRTKHELLPAAYQHYVFY